ncbi:MAG: DUF5615 family PIN-like protein [Bacteroidota bacterium]
MKKLVIDESVGYELVKILKEANFDLLSILETNPGVDDEKVLEIAFQEEAILLTEDKDFGELTYRMKRDSYGILLIRLIDVDKQQKCNIVLGVIETHLAELENSFSVLTSKKLRIKKMK